MAKTLSVVLIAVACALVWMGCGGGGDKTVTVTTGTTATTGTTGTTRTTGSTGATESAPTEIVRETSFQSPTGNIGCMMISGGARCDIVKRTWEPPPRPADCPSQTDYGQGVEVGRSGKGEIVCAGDTARDPSAPKLAYDTASQVGDLTCVSRPTGVTCTNRSTGHGFLINAERYDLF